MLKRSVGVLLVALTAAATFAWWPFEPGPPSSVEDVDDFPVRFLRALESNDFPRVPPRWEFAFPADHGPHDAYRTEWWYLTGTLDRRESPPLGIQLVLTRLAVVPQRPERPSAWATSAIYAGLLTMTDPSGGPPTASVRTSRAALGLAGAKTEPPRIWLENWRLEHSGPGDTGGLDWKLRVASDELELELGLRAVKPSTLSSEVGERGRGSPPPFHFYLQPRMEAKGTLHAAGSRWTLRGLASLEHAWGELPLPGGPVARDRFTLFLDDGRELFCIRTHRVDGAGGASTSCILVGRDGHATVLSGEELDLEPVEHWSSEHTGARYPVDWVLRLPGQGLALRLTSHSEREEVTLWEPAWAGPLRVRGGTAGRSIAGEGFVQLNGYHEP